jgi:hypothetical protein
MAHPDFEEFVAAFNARRVRYLIVGAHAVALHARPRATKDLDIFVEPTKANARRVLLALADFFGGTPPGYGLDDIVAPDIVLQLGVAPVRIDLMSRVSGIAHFRHAWSRRVDSPFGAEPAHFLSRDDLVAAKTAAGRPQDVADLVSLRRAIAKSK